METKRKGELKVKIELIAEIHGAFSSGFYKL